MMFAQTVQLLCLRRVTRRLSGALGAQCPLCVSSCNQKTTLKLANSSILRAIRHNLRMSANHILRTVQLIIHIKIRSTGNEQCRQAYTGLNWGPTAARITHKCQHSQKSDGWALAPSSRSGRMSWKIQSVSLMIACKDSLLSSTRCT